MKLLLAVLTLLFCNSLFAQLPSSKTFDEVKILKNISFTTLYQDGEDTITHAAIPCFLQTISVKKNNSSYNIAKMKINKLVNLNVYKNIRSVKDEIGNELQVYVYDEKPNYEILIYTKDANSDFMFVSISTKNLTEQQKKQVINQMSISLN